MQNEYSADSSPMSKIEKISTIEVVYSIKEMESKLLLKRYHQLKKFKKLDFFKSEEPTEPISLVCTTKYSGKQVGAGFT